MKAPFAMTLKDMIYRSCELNADRPALAFVDDDPISYRELREQIARFDPAGTPFEGDVPFVVIAGLGFGQLFDGGCGSGHRGKNYGLKIGGSMLR